MSTIVTIASGDQITNSRSDINTNFSNLNTDKIETSTLDTDTTLAANSDSKIATQKAVKAYVDAGGNVNASTTTKGIVEEATSAEMIAGTAAGGTGARLFLNPSLVAETGADKIVKTKSTGKLDTSIVPGITVAVGTTTKDVSVTTTTTIAHGLGVIPSLVRISALLAAGSTSENISITLGLIAGGAASSIFATIETGTLANGASFTIYADASSGNFLVGTLSVDATNISITWAKTGSPTGTAQLLWEAIK